MQYLRMEIFDLWNIFFCDLTWGSRNWADKDHQIPHIPIPVKCQQMEAAEALLDSFHQQLG